MATRTRRRTARRKPASRRRNTPRRNAKGRFVKGGGKRKTTRRRTARRRNTTRAANPVRRRRRPSTSRRRRPAARRRRRNTSSALAASVSSGPRAVNTRRRRKPTTRRRRRNSSSAALARSVSAGKPRAVNRRRRRNSSRRRNVGVVKELQSIFSPQNIGAMLVGSSVRGAAGGLSMTALSAVLSTFPDQTTARKPVVVLPMILGAAAIGRWVQSWRSVQRMKSRYFDPDDISRGIADQFRDVLYLTIAGAAPGSAQILGVMSPAVASMLALAAPADAAGILVQTTAGQRRTRGIVAQQDSLATAGLSTMSEEASFYGDEDMG